jgi:beta-glucosidase
MGRDLAGLVAELTLEEKESLLNGDSMWYVAGVERLGIPRLKVTDGPAGARGDGFLDSGTPTLCIPCGAALGATWNPELVAELGAALGEEARAKGCHVLLAPTINLHRNPLGGRNFECYSEDPLLTGVLATAFVQGVQSHGVATTPKHFVANDSEFERNTIDSVVDERTLRELYLRPFEMVVAAGAWGLMSSYNRLNGTFCSEHPWLVRDLLLGEWGFDGFVVTDWFAARSTAATAMAGTTLEMPGPGRWFGRGRLSAAVGAGEVDQAVVDDMVLRMLRLLERTGAFAEPEIRPEATLDTAEQRALARTAAADAMVLLRNEGGLVPLDASRLRRIAVVGPNAARTQIMGGGSAALHAYRRRSVLAALEDRLGDSVEIVHERGCDIERTAPVVAGPFTVQYWPESFAGEPVHTETIQRARLVHFGARHPIPRRWVARATGSYTAVDTGRHRISLVGLADARVSVDGEVVIDLPDGAPRSEFLFGLGSEERLADLELAAGQRVELVVELPTAGAPVSGFQLGMWGPTPPDLLDRAVAAAAAADAVIVVVGTNDDWETEGHDRASMTLPGPQDELVTRVLAANATTVVVVNTGSVVEMDWADDAAAILQAWFGGQEMGDAVADVLLGSTDPGGRLPLTVPVRAAHAPSWLGYPGENSVVRYGEGIFVGYRGYEATDRAPRFPFGHGLSTTSFALSAPRLSAATVAAGDEVVVDVDVTNTGPRPGTEVVQCYRSQASPRLARPLKELVAFAKVHLEPGQSRTVSLRLDATAFRYFDPGDPTWAALQGAGPVPAGGNASHRADAGWVVDPGDYTLHVGTSSAAIAHVVELTLT